MHVVTASRAPRTSKRSQRYVTRHFTLRLDTTDPVEFIDLTDRLAAFVGASSLDVGLASVQTCHTTTGLIVNELEPLLLDDLREAIERRAPRTAEYRHDDLSRRTVNLVPGERRNGHAHCQALGLRASENVHVVGGRLQLGRWQRVLFVELDGPQRREVSMMVMGTGRL